jgi:hypothetical protein
VIAVERGENTSMISDSSRKRDRNSGGQRGRRRSTKNVNAPEVRICRIQRDWNGRQPRPRQEFR